MKSKHRIMLRTFFVIGLQVVLCWNAPNAIIGLLIGLMAGRVHYANLRYEVERYGIGD